MGVGKRYLNIVLMILAVVVATESLAQIHIIPREKIDSIANPVTVAAEAMAFEGGNAISFGQIKEDAGEWSYSIKWQNRGEKPLIITRITSSCSCLKVDAERKTVAVDGQGVITLRYNPERRVGTVNQRAFIYTNLSDKFPTAVITLSGRVIAGREHGGDYPHALGTLLLRQDTLTVRQGGQVRVACMNSGEQPLRLSVDTLLSPQGVKAYTEPRELQAGEDGDLVLMLPAKVNQKVVSVYLQGLRLAPRQRRVVLIVEE